MTIHQVVIGVAAILAGCFPPLQAATLVLSGMADASAIEPLPDATLIIAGDEDNTLRLYRPPATAPIRTLPLDSLFPNPDPKHPERDIEALAIHTNTLYLITSHGASKNGKPRPARRLFAALTYPGLQPLGHTHTLLSTLLTDPRYTPFALAPGLTLPPKEKGALNIEGLAALPGGTLLIGFRSPVPGGLALIAPLENPHETLTRRAAPRWGDPIRLDLEGKGIRSLHTHRDTLYILADGAALHTAPLTNLTALTRRTLPKTKPALTPEGLTIHGDRLLIVSDDGTLKIDGVENKTLPQGRQTFRLLSLPLFD